jgi:hypothetical protein
MRFKLILLLTFFYCTVSYSQLNGYASFVKENDSARFSMIQEYSKNKWKTDVGAIEYEINKQSEGYMLAMELLNKHFECADHKPIIVMEMLKYSTDLDNFSDANWYRIYQEIKNRMD